MIAATALPSVVVIAAIVVPAFMPAVATVVIPVLLAPITAPLAMPGLVARHIFTVVPVIFDEINRLTAGVVFVAMLAPMFGMAGRHPQINRRPTVRRTFDQDGLRINKCRPGETANVDLTIKTGLANADGNANIGSEYG